MIVGTMPKQIEYALMALAEMQSANPGHLFSARELCDRHQVPFDVMSKTMQRLCRAGILRSVQGKYGGYQIIRDLAVLSLLELMEAVLGDVATVSCLKTGGDCPLAATCNVSGPMQVLDRKLRDLYAGLTVMELITAGSTCCCEA
jgi:Rrf2 family protein